MLKTESLIHIISLHDEEQFVAAVKFFLALQIMTSKSLLPFLFRKKEECYLESENYDPCRSYFSVFGDYGDVINVGEEHMGSNFLTFRGN